MDMVSKEKHKIQQAPQIRNSEPKHIQISLEWNREKKD